MQSARFDAVVRAASRAGPRRGLLGGLAALALPPLVVQAKPTPAGQAACQPPGAVCRKSADCCATACHKKRGKKRGHCTLCANGALYCGTACCQSGEDCAGGSCTCSGASCPNGCCGKGTCVAPPTDAACGINGAACAVCVAPETCGGGDAPGVCGCTPTTCSAQGVTCGTIDDGCGRQRDCGSCSSCETCRGGSCIYNGDGTSCTFPNQGVAAIGLCQNGTCICRPSGAPCNCNNYPSLAGCCSLGCGPAPGADSCTPNGICH